MFLLVSCKKEIRKEIYLIPDGFTGHMVVVYMHRGGELDSVIDNTVIYKIPKNGILYLEGHQYLQDLSRMKYYYYDTKGLNEELCRYKIDDNNNCNAMVYNHSIGSYQQTAFSHRYDYAVITIGVKGAIPDSTFDPQSFKFKVPN